MKKIIAIVPVLAFLAFAGVASAHVSIKPAEVGVGKFQTFTISVPSERPIATVGLRLVLPEGLEHVSPTVKPGWKISLVHGDAATGDSGHGDGDETAEVIKEIVWTGGNIPGEFRDEFTFSAKVPASEMSILWKAYQTYQDGAIVSWELGPNEEQPKNAQGSADYSAKGPGSITKVVNDLAPAATNNSGNSTAQNNKTSKSADTAMTLSILAVLLSAFSLYLAKRR